MRTGSVLSDAASDVADTMRDRFDEGVTGAREMWDRLGRAARRERARPTISSWCIECVVAFCAYFCLRARAMQEIKRPAPGVTAPRFLQRKNNPEASEKRGASSVATGTVSTAPRCASLIVDAAHDGRLTIQRQEPSHVRLQHACHSVSARQGRRNACLHRFSRNQHAWICRAEETRSRSVSYPAPSWCLSRT